jgi:imidazoleglycerol-phosphate dehydratase/histidinol-phosphatase
LEDRFIDYSLFSKKHMKRVLFIDRDGTLIVEPPDDFQIDTLEKLEFIPKVFRNMFLIVQNLDFELVMVSNQDGLGSPAYPFDSFNRVQQKVIKAFGNEGIVFSDVHIDSSMPDENAPTRKPKTGMLGKYLEGEYNLAESFVIGDRITDVELAKNLGCKAILLGPESLWQEIEKEVLTRNCALITDNWDRIYSFLAAPVRIATFERNTRETRIKISLNLDGTGKTSISTGFGFFDHLLDQIGRHSGCDLTVLVKGDLHVDEHHTIEDTALALGEVFRVALGDKKGIERYGFMLPMDDCLATVAVDFGGRPWLVWNAHFNREKVGDLPTEMFYHFFKSFSDGARCNLNIKAEGVNEHHKIEAIFKAFARAMKIAFRRDVFNAELPSTKGIL